MSLIMVGRDLPTELVSTAIKSWAVWLSPTRLSNLDRPYLAYRYLKSISGLQIKPREQESGTVFIYCRKSLNLSNVQESICMANVADRGLTAVHNKANTFFVYILRLGSV
jgi:hypothetical protein